MGDSQQPKPAAPLFEVPDLELEPVSRSVRTPGRAVAPESKPKPDAVAPPSTGTPNRFDDEDFLDNGATLELALDDPTSPHPAPSSARTASTNALRDASGWPTGRAPDRARLAIDPSELALLSGYGEAPTNPLLSPAYAYRVFTRQRELKAELGPLDRDLLRAENERENALAQLARAVRPEAERVEQLRRLLSPLLELEQVAASRGQALSDTNADLDRQASAIDRERDAIAAELELALASERAAQHARDAAQELFRRADAKLKRVHIEIRAVTQVIEHQLGPNGGPVPAPEASQLAELRARSTVAETELQVARLQLENAETALDHASARVAAVRQNEHLASRKKQALLTHYRQELDLRGRSLDESAEQRDAALADLGRAVLALRGAVVIPEPLIARVRAASDCADALALRAERHLRALDAYDHARASQGVKLACTACAAFFVLLALKILL